MEHVVVKTLTGKAITCTVDFATVTVEQLKELVQDREGIPPDRQRMIFCGRLLHDGTLLSQYGVRHGSVVHLVLRLRGPDPIFVELPHLPSDPAWPSTEVRRAFMCGEWRQLVQLSKGHGIHMWRSPSESSRSLLAIIEGPTGSLYEGGKFVVEVNLLVGSGSPPPPALPQLRMITPIHHPTTTANGAVALFDDSDGFWTPRLSHPRHGSSVEHALRALRSQLLIHDVGGARAEALLKHNLAGPVMAEWQMSPREAQRKARVMTALCAMTEQERSTSRSWLAHFIPHCAPLYTEVRSLLMAAATDALTGEPRHPEAVLVAGLPQELMSLVIHHLALTYVAEERAKLVAPWWSARSATEWPVPDDWRAQLLTGEKTET